MHQGGAGWNLSSDAYGREEFDLVIKRLFVRYPPRPAARRRDRCRQSGL
jgi:hypothetical protein